jgi:hypothetical protein
MSPLVLPPRLTRQLELERAEREAVALAALQGDAQDRWRREFNAQLERVVHGMKLMWCPDPAPLDAVAQGAFPGRWNLVWPGFNGGPLSVQPLVLRDGEPRIGGEGGFVEPGSWVFDRIAEADMWSERVMRERRRIKAEAEEAKRRRREIERAEFDQDCLERWKAVSRASVSMNTSTPWSQNHAGLRAAKAAARERAEDQKLQDLVYENQEIYAARERSEE